MAKARRYRWQNLRQHARSAPVTRKQGSPQPRLRGKPTPAQIEFIDTLSKRLREPAPKVRTRAEASAVISDLMARRPPPEPERPDFV